MGTSVMGLMMLDNIAPKPGFNPKLIATEGLSLTITLSRLPDAIALSMPGLSVCVAPCLGGQCSLLHSSS